METKYNVKKGFKIKLGGIIVAVVLVLALIGLLICSTTIKAGYVGVVYNANGGIENTVLNQGWYTVAPWKHVTSYPVSTETVYLSKGVKESGKDDDSVMAGTADGKPINMDVSYTYHFDSLKVKDIFTKFRGQSASAIADSYIRRFIKDDLNEISTQYGTFDVYGTKRTEVAQKTYQKLTEDLKKDGIIIESFSITDVRPDAETTKAIQAKVNAIQALEQAKVEKDKAVVEADKKVAVAKGDADSAKIKADGEAYANKVKQASITPELIQYTLATKWDGKQPIVVGGNGAILDLSKLMTDNTAATK
jgi:regulator of protease activity HflC (stomatin/prohibitin superfamily)